MNYLNFALRVTIWLLLTADFGLVNLVIGILVSLLLPQGQKKSSAPIGSTGARAVGLP